MDPKNPRSPDEYKSVAGYGEAEFIIEKSRFIGYALPVSSEEEARAFIAELRELHPQATHVCSAWIIGAGGLAMRFSDDGEPSGTAGVPMLEVLKKEGLTAAISGSGETVTGQIPSPGQTVPGGSQVLLFLGQTPEPETVKVPDFYGMNRQQASDAAGALGLYILVTGNDEISTGVTVTAQNVAKDTEVPAGTTITLVFADTAARD